MTGFAPRPTTLLPISLARPSPDVGDPRPPAIGYGPGRHRHGRDSGITPKVLDFARQVRDLGCTVVLPVLFGQVGHDPNPDSAGAVGSVAAMGRAVVTMCVSREFTLLATRKTSPVVP